MVGRVRLHEDVAGDVRKRRSLAELTRGTRVVLRIGRVAGVDLENRRLAFADGGHEAFDDLVVATGSVASRPSIPGIERAWSCDNEAEAFALRKRLHEGSDARVVVVGGGLTGIELASELAERRRGLAVSLVTDAEVAPLLSEGGRAHVRSVLAGLGVALHEHARVGAFEEDGAVLGSGARVPCDVAIWAGGLVASPFGRSIGLAVDERGRALVDDRFRSTSHPFVRVVGDAAKSGLRMACATALPQGAYVADDVARELRARATLPFSFAYFVQCVSLGRRNGIVQKVDAWDAPTSLFLGGGAAAFVKERICRYPIASVRLERWGFGYRWPEAPKLARLTAHAAGRT